MFVAAALGQEVVIAPARPTEVAAAPSLLQGYRRYNGICGHCLGPDGIGSTFAPPLIERVLPFDQFEEVVLEGRATGTSVMDGYADDPNITPYVRDIYHYLGARADGTLGRGWPKTDP